MAQEKSQLKAGIGLNYLNLLIGSLIPLIYTPIMLNLLGQNEYGLYKLAVSVTSYLGLVSIGIGSAVSRYIIKAREEGGKEEEEKFLGMFMLIFQVIALVALIVGIILALNIHLWYHNSLAATDLRTLKILLFILTANTTLSFQLTPYLSVVSAHEKFIFVQWMNIITSCLGPILNLVVLYLGFSSIGMASSTLALGVVVRFAYFCYVNKTMGIKPRYCRMPKGILKEMLIFSFWVFFANIVGELYNATDLVMIGLIPTMATIGIAVYNVGQIFNGMVLSLTTALSNLLSPKVNKLVFAGASYTELTNLAIKAGRIQAYIITLIVTGFISFGKPFIKFYVGIDYMEAYWVAILIMIPHIIPLVQSVFLSIIVAQNKHRFRSLVYLAIAVINVIGTWFLLHTSLGIVGAALMTSVSMLIGHGFVMNWFYWKKTGLEIGRFWKEVGKLYILPCIMCALALLLCHWVEFERILALIVGIVIYTVLYCAGVWFFEMNSYEREMIKTLSKFIFAFPHVKFQNDSVSSKR